jgi:tetratricopeptide (TPR) repeat protein
VDVSAIGEGLASENPMMRTGALDALDAVDPQIRFRMAHPLLDDPVRSVRIEAALVLAGTPRGVMNDEQYASLERGLEEYRQAQLFNGDRVEAHLNLGLLHTYRGELERAENSYRTALELDPGFMPVYVNLADLYRVLGRDELGRSTLEEALGLDPENAEVLHALGLLLARQQQLTEAVEKLRLAAELNPGSTRYAYVYGVALFSQGDDAAARQLLREPGVSNP